MYGGTKTEMERLLKDAQELSGVEYNIDNLGDVYDAIHVIQEDLGLTGVAAAEASETFSGSFNAMKASAQNFLGSLAIGENVSEALGQLMTSASTFFFNNFIPMLGTIIKSLPGAIWTFLQQGVPLLLSNVSTLVSNFATSISSLADGLTGEKVAAWISTTLPKILSAAGSIIKKFASGLIANLPKIVAALGRIGAAIVRGLGAALWGRVSAAAAGIRDRFMAPINSISERFSAVVERIKSFFPISVGNILGNIKLPHFKISGSFSLNPPSTPKLSIDWYAKGGIIDSATVLGGVGLGEAGPEAILPLTPFWDRMDKIADSVQNGAGNTFNFYISGDDPKTIAQEVKKIIITEVNQRRLAWR